MSEMKREDENRLKRLTERSEARDPTMTELDYLWLSVLEDRYTRFLEEGVRIMRATASLHEMKTGGNGSVVGNFLSSVGKSVRRGGGITSPKSGGPTSPATDTARLCKHWSWVSDSLIVGALPLAAPCGGDPSAHLHGLKEQCQARACSVGLVVSCLELCENDGDLAAFAGPRDWEEQLGVSAFVHVALPMQLDAEIDVDMGELVAACDQMHEVVVREKKAVYLHCKAGTARSWVVVMAYLISQRFLNVDEARGLLAVVRQKYAPTPAQEAFVRRFAAYLAEDGPQLMRNSSLAQAEMSDAEKYSKLLTELLSLPREYRQRLVKDLERLS
jgi:hypothetical protein